VHVSYVKIVAHVCLRVMANQFVSVVWVTLVIGVILRITKVQLSRAGECLVKMELCMCGCIIVESCNVHVCRCVAEGLTAHCIDDNVTTIATTRPRPSVTPTGNPCDLQPCLGNGTCVATNVSIFIFTNEFTFIYKLRLHHWATHVRVQTVDEVKAAKQFNRLVVQIRVLTMVNAMSTPMARINVCANLVGQVSIIDNNK
jgi:hypothetical protein